MTGPIVDVFSQRIVAWHCATTKHVELVETPLRMALWDRNRQGHPVTRGELICHSDAGSQYTAIRFTEHLALEGITPSIVAPIKQNLTLQMKCGRFIFHKNPRSKDILHHHSRTVSGDILFYGRYGSVGDAYDNALMETINGLYKTECIRTTVFHDDPYK